MATVDRFSELIGICIKSCGMLEFHVNHFIKSLGKDPILVEHVTKLVLNRRINVLRDLMLDQPELTAPEVNSLCNELEKIAKDRNVIAHNPVVISAPSASLAIYRPQSEVPLRLALPSARERGG